MPTTTLYSKSGAEMGTIDLPEQLFNVEVNPDLVHQAVIAQLAARRTGTHDTKTRGEVRGGGAKPYRQKGTGRARQGSRSAPHYAGGGVVFGPHPRSYEQRLPKRMKRLALQGALTAKFGDGAIKVVDELSMDEQQDARAGRLPGRARRRPAGSCLSPMAPTRSWRSARNLPTVSILRADSLNVVDVLNADVLLICQPALATMAEVYA